MKIGFAILLITAFSSFQARATHIIGGEFSYSYLGDTLGAVSKYSVSVSIYEDCLNGSLAAIQDDDPAFLSIFDNDRTTNDPTFYNDTGLYYTFSETVPVNFSNKCVSNIPATCVLKKTFTRTYYLPHNSSGYVIAYQRCCRNNAINNIVDAGGTGSTFYCTIPAWPVVNNSAVFKNYPPQVICLDNPLYYDNSATDADGDSLSYEFCVSLNCCGGSNSNPKPIPTHPNELPPLYYDSVNYNPGYSSAHPLSGFPPIQIDPATGIISGTPNLQDRYLVTICCNEWRNGVIINTAKREFQFVVTSCSKVVDANIPQFSTDPNTYIVDCSNYTVNFINASTGGFSYYWDFGVTGASYDTSSLFQPTFIYPDTGTFDVRLIVNPGSTCPDSINRLVKIYPKFYADFSDTGMLCPGDTITFQDLSLSTIKPIDRWRWSFGDGDSSFIENPAHVYATGGTYNVVLISENIKDCVDTALKQVLIESFKPFAGNDTIIVKGQSMVFDATGGVQYSWYPGDNLNNINIYDPTGDFPDTGTFNYVVEVKSEFGCNGSDTMQVTVVGQAEFFVPTAFSPNGDGKNDIFKPVAVGYKSINYFSVYNRWGQRVYTGNSFEEGWNGYFNNQKAETGVYFWEISFVDRFGKTGFTKGDVTLVR